MPKSRSPARTVALPRITKSAGLSSPFAAPHVHLQVLDLLARALTVPLPQAGRFPSFLPIPALLDTHEWRRQVFSQAYEDVRRRGGHKQPSLHRNSPPQQLCSSESFPKPLSWCASPATKGQHDDEEQCCKRAYYQYPLARLRFLRILDSLPTGCHASVKGGPSNLLF